MLYHCIVIDFDNTIAHFIGQGGSKGFFQIFAQHGIPKAPVEKCYKDIKNTLGFSIERFLNELVLQGVMLVSRAVAREQLQQEFERWLLESLVLYPDSLLSLKYWHECHIPICIITAGDERFQQHKIALVHPPYDEIVVVTHVNEKANAEKAILARFGGRIMVIDDKASELDAARDAGLTEEEVETVRINRPDSPYRDQVPKYRHREIFNLVEALPEFAMR